MIFMTPPLDSLKKALGDVDNLIDHHYKSAVPGTGTPPLDERPLLRSCVVLAYAAWEVYVENGVLWAVDQLVTRSAPDTLPEPLRNYVASEKAVKNNPWQLAGEQWRSTVVNVITRRVRGDNEKSFGMNTAGPEQVILLYDQILGISPLRECSWQNSSNSKVRRDVLHLVQVRGEIVHTGQISELNLQGVRDWRDFVMRLAGRFDELLDSGVEKLLTQQAPT